MRIPQNTSPSCGWGEGNTTLHLTKLTKCNTRIRKILYNDLSNEEWAQIIIIIIIIQYGCLCHRHFFLVPLLNQRWSPSLRLQASHCSTFRIMCDVPRIAVLTVESAEYFLGMVSKFFFKTFVTIPVAPITSDVIIHFRFHIRCVDIIIIVIILLYYLLTYLLHGAESFLRS